MAHLHAWQSKSGHLAHLLQIGPGNAGENAIRRQGVCGLIIKLGSSEMAILGVGGRSARKT
eukprot:3730253-Alexandrium_andersonii.AAC.1